HGKIAILFIKRPGWEKYMKKYTEVLEANGVNQFNYIPLNANPTHAEVQNLKSCTGMIICGGETELYQRYLVGTIFGEEIILMYQRGVQRERWLVLTNVSFHRWITRKMNIFF